MILEVALLDVTPGTEQAFRDAYDQGRGLIEASSGWRSIRMTQGIETPTRFVLLVEWDAVSSHEAFRASDDFGRWRALIGPHFAGPPRVEHFNDV